MISTILILFGFTMLGGIAALFTTGTQKSIRYPLIFAGSFLFSITIIHILPEVFSLSENPMRIGLFILLGFFIQQILEYFTSGIEHGHFHAHGKISSGSQIGLLIALMIHSLMEGALLTHDSPFHAQHESYSLLVGILLHKVPAAFALISTLKTSQRFTSKLWIVLIIFSLSSPLGLLLNDQLSMHTDNLLILSALVCGSFLHISTTIFVESSPNHRFGFDKILTSASGAAVAILAEYIM